MALLGIPAVVASGPEEAPVALVAMPSGTSTVTLSWSEPASSNGTGLEYRVYRGDGLGPSALVAAVTDTSFVDAVSINATTTGILVYQVTAVNAVGFESPPSNPAVVPMPSCIGIDETTSPPTVYYPDDPLDCLWPPV